jgi:hypothetical protein
MQTSNYVDDVYQVIKTNFRPNDPSGSMSVATVAYLAKLRLKLDYRTFGFAKFKDVLAELERQGLIRTGVNSKLSYAIWLTEAPSAATTATVAPATIQLTAPLPVARPFRPLRNPVWFAFVGEYPPGRRFLNRKTGELRVGISESPGTEWAEITPVSPEQEKEEANKFLGDHQLNSPELQNALSSAKWFTDFPFALSAMSGSLASEWKRRRSIRIADIVRKWCFEHSVEPEVVFENEPPREVVSTIEQTDDVRAILLDALKQMTTEELLTLPIPARLIIGAARPELRQS